MADLGAPVRVSPLIKQHKNSLKKTLHNTATDLDDNLFMFGRWSFLAVGVVYGAYHQSRLSKKAGKEREIEAQKKIVRDAQIAEEKKRAGEREAAEWAKISAPAPKK